MSRSWLAFVPLGGDGRKAALLAGCCRRHFYSRVRRKRPIESYDDDLMEQKGLNI